MTSNELLAKLQTMEPALRQAGIIHLSVFGSAARNQSTRDSDIDLLAEFDTARRISILDIASLQVALTETLGRPVDLVEMRSLKPTLRDSIAADTVCAFSSSPKASRPAGNPPAHS